LGNAATGLVAGINAARLLKEKPLITFPRETMIGSLCFYVSNAEKDTFQPMKANFGLLPPITPRIKNKGDRKIAYSNRALKMINNLYNSEP